MVNKRHYDKSRTCHRMTSTNQRYDKHSQRNGLAETLHDEPLANARRAREVEFVAERWCEHEVVQIGQRQVVRVGDLKGLS